MTIVSRIWERIRRRIQVEKNLFFEYEVSPHRAFLAKIARRDTDLTDMNKQVGIDHKDAKAVAQTYLKAKAIIK